MPERREIDNPQAVAQLAVRLVVFLIEAFSRLLFFLVITAMWILAGTVETRGTLWRRRLESRGVQNLERLRELCSQAIARLDYVIYARVNLELKQQRQLRELEEWMKLENKGKKKLKAKGGIKIKDKGEGEEEKEKKKEEEENEKKKGKKVMGAKGGIKIKEKGEEEDEEKEKKKEEEEEEENGDGGGGRKKDGE